MCGDVQTKKHPFLYVREQVFPRRIFGQSDRARVVIRLPGKAIHVPKQLMMHLGISTKDIKMIEECAGRSREHGRIPTLNDLHGIASARNAMIERSKYAARSRDKKHETFDCLFKAN